MKIWKSITSFFSKAFGTGYDRLKKNSAIAVKVTDELKKYVESPIADVVVNLIPGNWDNYAIVALRKVLPPIAIKMAITHKIIEGSTSPSDCVVGIIEYLKTLDKEARIGFWITFAGELTKALSDGKLTFAEAVILSQLAYKELYESH